MEAQKARAALMAVYAGKDPRQKPKVVLRYGFVPTLLVWSYSDVAAVMTAPWASRRFVPRFLLRWLSLTLSGPVAMPRNWRHKLLRMLIQEIVSPGALRVADMYKYIPQLARKVVANAIASGKAFDLTDITETVTYETVCELLGLDGAMRSEAQRREFFEWLNEYGKATPFAIPAQKHVKAYYRKFIRERQQLGLNEPVDILLRAKRLSEYDKMAMVFFVMLSATLTTSYAISSTYILMSTDPRFEEWCQAIRESKDDRIIGAMYREALRLCGPTDNRPFLVRRPVRFAGHWLLPGMMVEINWSSANRDPAAFDDPLAFEPYRTWRMPSLAFSVGDYACPGQQLSLITAAAVLRALLELLQPPRVKRVRITPGGAHRMDEVLVK